MSASDKAALPHAGGRAALVREAAMQEKLYPVSPEWARRAHIDGPQYEAMYAASVQDPEGFWYEQGGRIDWFRPFTKVKNTSFGGPGTSGEVFIRWFEDGVLNAAYNCIDRHLERRGDQVAIIWEGDDPSESRKITYRELHDEVCRFANVLRNRGVGKGDRVTIYLPMVPEAAYAILACARLGAIHSVVFGGFAASSLAARIDDAKPALMITADGGSRMGKPVLYKSLVDESLKIARHPPKK